MSVGRRQDGPKRPYGRPDATRTGGRFLIVCEGAATEPAYFDEVKARLRMQGIRIEHPESTHPAGLLEAAIGWMEESAADKLPYHQTWLVFDTEGVHDIRKQQVKEIGPKARAAGIEIAHSTPSFEFWLLLHFIHTTEPFASAKEVLRVLKTKWPKYNKALTRASDLMRLVPEAVTRAQLCRNHHASFDSQCNPSTDVDRLIRELNKSAAPYAPKFSLEV
jgi:hypothetical protein